MERRRFLYSIVSVITSVQLAGCFNLDSGNSNFQKKKFLITSKKCKETKNKGEIKLSSKGKIIEINGFISGQSPCDTVQLTNYKSNSSNEITIDVEVNNGKRSNCKQCPTTFGYRGVIQINGEIPSKIYLSHSTLNGGYGVDVVKVNKSM